MTPQTSPPRLMIMDACVLIDFLKTERAILRLVINHVGSLYVTSPVVDEINEVDSENELEALGLIIIEPEMEDAYAASGQGGPLSFEDRLCLLTAKRHGFICVTNDKNLRKVCDQEGVPLLWGLELVAELHMAGGISLEAAETLAKAIHQSNPKHITENIISRFMSRIRRQEGR